MTWFFDEAIRYVFMASQVKGSKLLIINVKGCKHTKMVKVTESRSKQRIDEFKSVYPKGKTGTNRSKNRKMFATKRQRKKEVFFRISIRPLNGLCVPLLFYFLLYTFIQEIATQIISLNRPPPKNLSPNFLSVAQRSRAQ